MTLKKKYVVISSLVIVSVLLGSLFYHNIVQGQGVSDYDPWADLNDDGKIDMRDVYVVARKFGTTGTPINKTALLLELSDRVDSLNASFLELQNRVTILETDFVSLESSLVEIETRLGELEMNKSIYQMSYTPGSSDSFTPSSASHTIVIVAKGVAWAGGALVHLWGTAQLKDEETVLDSTQYGFTYDHGPADFAWAFSLVWSGNLPEETHTIQITITDGSLMDASILILEIAL